MKIYKCCLVMLFHDAAKVVFESFLYSWLNVLYYLILKFNRYKCSNQNRSIYDIRGDRYLSVLYLVVFICPFLNSKQFLSTLVLTSYYSASFIIY